MKKLKLTAIVLSVFLFTAFKPSLGILISNDTHIGFFSHTAVEDITANNYKAVSTLDTGTGDIVFSVPMQSFEFENALMQKHYNSAKFLNTKKFPKAKFTGKITDMKSVDLSKDGTYPVTVSGDLTIKGETRPLHEKAIFKVEAGKVILDSPMKVVLADYGITFTDGKPSTNIAKEIKITVKAVYQKE